MQRLSVTQVFPAAAAIVLAVMASQLLRAPEASIDKVSWTAALADRGAYPDARLREMETFSSSQMGALIGAEMRRRGMQPGV